MILIGRNLSPFVRRVAIWMLIQERPFEQQRLAATDPADAEAIRAHHPVTRVPALVLDDGTSLIESFAICDYLDETMPERRLVPASGAARRDTLQHIALAHQTTEKIVALVYEKNRRPAAYHWPEWQERVVWQIRGGLEAMEAAATGSFHGGEGPDGADIATVVAYEMAATTNPFLLEGPFTLLAALQERAAKIDAFPATNPAA